MTVEPPTLPVTFRPVWGRRVAFGIAALLVAVLTGIAVALPPEWTIVDRLLIVVVAVVGAFLLYALGRVRVEASERGLRVVNLVHTRLLDWPDVLAVRLRPDDPWASLDLWDGTVLAAMGIQTADGARGRRAAAQLAALVEAHSGTEPVA